LHFQPFELNPQIAAADEDLSEHLKRKYRASAVQAERSHEVIRTRGEELGFNFHMAELEGRQQALQHALFAAYF
jgi:predicted DsbA family dithiol-disulfide isomerase